MVIQVPKFEVSDSLDLKPVLEGLGAGIVFDDEQADFSNLSEAALGLSSIKQETTLSIDEKGVTAAAYTQIDYAGAAPPDGRAELILDRPFLFAVVTNGVPCLSAQSIRSDLPYQNTPISGWNSGCFCVLE